MEEVKVFYGRLAMVVDDDFYEVETFIEGEKLVKDCAYIHNDYVYIYRGKKSKFEKPYPVGIYMDKNKEYIFVHPNSKMDREKYSIENVLELNPENIFSSIEADKDSFINPDDIETINNNSKIWKPTYKENDDFLKFAVKKIIENKKINLKNYKDRFINQYALNNLKAGLNKDTKMTVSNFKTWSEVLGCRWTLIIEDDGTDRLNPLKDEIVIKSEDF